jgi:hypothetical protein
MDSYIQILCRFQKFKRKSPPLSLLSNSVNVATGRVTSVSIVRVLNDCVFCNLKIPRNFNIIQAVYAGSTSRKEWPSFLLL